jgi:hypothetical protein
MSLLSQLLPDVVEKAEDAVNKRTTLPRDHRANVSNGPMEKPGVRNTTPSGTRCFAEDERNTYPTRAFVRLTAV